ncbi:MAG: ABC transporter substrate-binding protein [Gammaproteobacteria bacterium]
MTRLSLRHIFGAAIVAVALGGAIDAKPANAQGTFIYGMPIDHSILDPHVTCGWMAKFVNYHIYEALVEIDLQSPDWPTKFKGQLAETWEISDDGTEYTFHLRSGVKFHDGSPMNAAAVKYNFDRFLNPEASHYNETANAYMGFIRYVADIKSVDVIDDLTVKITLTGPNYEFLRTGMEDCPQMYIISPTALQTYGDEGIPLHPIGTGPFKFVDRDPSVSTTLERNDDYWGEKAKLERIIFRIIEDPPTRVNALLAGEVHAIQDPPWDEIEGLESEGFVITKNENAPTIWYLSFNMNNPEMQDVRVRQAVNYAINKQGIVDRILRGYGKPAYGMLNAGTYAYDPNFVSYQYDPDKARALLAEAGYADGLDLYFDVMIYGTGELTEKWIQRDLKKVGINLIINKMEWLAYLDKWVPGMTDDVHMNEMIWGEQLPRWTAFGYRCDRVPPDGNNIGWYCNADMDDLFQLALETADESKRAALYQQADSWIMMNDPANAPIYHYFNPIALHPSVKGFVNAPSNWWDFSRVWIEE